MKSDAPTHHKFTEVLFPTTTVNLISSLTRLHPNINNNSSSSPLPLILPPHYRCQAMTRLTGFTHFLGRSICTRTRNTHPLRHARLITLSRTLATSPTSSSEIPDFGNYSIILPPDPPYKFGTSHIPSLPVPSNITLPQYAIERQRRREAGESDSEIDGGNGDLDPWSGDGLVSLGGEEERGIREAAKLARKAREYAGSLVKVSFVLVFLFLVCMYLLMKCRSG